MFNEEYIKKYKLTLISRTEFKNKYTSEKSFSYEEILQERKFIFSSQKELNIYVREILQLQQDISYTIEIINIKKLTLKGR